jgi:hypothetical protein
MRSTHAWSFSHFVALIHQLFVYHDLMTWLNTPFEDRPALEDIHDQQLPLDFAQQTALSAVPPSNLLPLSAAAAELCRAFAIRKQLVYENLGQQWMTTVTDINNSGVISGFFHRYGRKHTRIHRNAGTFTSCDDPNAVGNTMSLWAERVGDGGGISSTRDQREWHAGDSSAARAS